MSGYVSSRLSRRVTRLSFFSYNSSLSVPEGVNLCDASLILNKSAFFTYSDGPQQGSPSAFSNLFRYRLLYDRGGWWVDTDVICLSSDIPTYDRFFALESPEAINSAIIRFDRSDTVMERCFQEASSRGRRYVGERPAQDLSPE